MISLALFGAAVLTGMGMPVCDLEGPFEYADCSSPLEISYNQIDQLVTTEGASDEFRWFEVDYWPFAGPDIFLRATLQPGEKLNFLAVHPDGLGNNLLSVEIALVLGCTPQDPWVGFTVSLPDAHIAAYTNPSQDTQHVTVVLNSSSSGDCIRVIASVDRSVDTSDRSWGSIKAHF